MRPQDLIPAFIAKIAELKGQLPGDLECGAHLEYTNLPNYDQLAVIDDDDDYWQSEAAGYDLESLFEKLNELAPAFVSFGSHEGDGSDYGFWPNYDGMTEANIDGLDEFQADEVIVQYSDHGNVTVMDMERNVIWSTLIEEA
jgi:hypothetical protein